MEQIRIIKEMREHDKDSGRTDELVRPRFMVWENVPGAFSSNDGEDFRAVLEETAKVAQRDACIPRFEGKWPQAGCIMGDGWSIAWRVHDAQFWGVPQRRKRIALVADFGGTTAPEILFERKGVSGDSEQSTAQGQDAATDVRSGVEETGRAVSFQERAGKPGGGKGILIQNERTGALSTLNNQSVVYGISAYESNAMKSDNPNSGIYEAETARTLDLNGGSPACNQGGMAVVCLEGNGARESHRENGFVEGEVMYTLNTVEQHAVAYRGDAITSPVNASNPKPGDPCHTLTDDGRNYVVLENHPNDSRVKINEDGIVQTLSGRMGTGGGNTPMVMESMAFSDVAACRSAQDGRGAVYSQMMSDLEGNFVLGPVTASKASFFTNANSTGTAETLVATDYKDPQIVAYGMDRAAYNQGANAKFDFSVDEEKVGTCVAKGPGAVCARDYKGVGAQDNDKLVVGSLCARDYKGGTSVVRRLTPLECTRLQGFPDGWVDIGDWVDSNGKKHKDADSPKYKALGNSIALPFWEWMAKRMAAYLPEGATMASLFSGIGGFELVYARAGVKPVFSSEIEEYPIAVTKKHFGDDDLGLEGDYERYL